MIYMDSRKVYFNNISFEFIKFLCDKIGGGKCGKGGNLFVI